MRLSLEDLDTLTEGGALCNPDGELDLPAFEGLIRHQARPPPPHHPLPHGCGERVRLQSLHLSRFQRRLRGLSRLANA